MDDCADQATADITVIVAGGESGHMLNSLLEALHFKKMGSDLAQLLITQPTPQSIQTP